jgi:hypothetical protein
MTGIFDDDASYGLDQSAIADVINSSGVEGAITVTTTAIEAKVGASRLVNRKLLTVFNNGSQPIYFGYNSTVTTASGTPIVKDQSASWDVGDGLGVWLIASSGSHNVRVTEAS